MAMTKTISPMEGLHHDTLYSDKTNPKALESLARASICPCMQHPVAPSRRDNPWLKTSPSLPKTTQIHRAQHFRLLDLPLEVQRIIFDHCYEPWALSVTDIYWRLRESVYFSLDRYASDINPSPVLLSGLPSPSLSLTCKYIYKETNWSLMRSYLGDLQMCTRSCHLTFPALPSRLDLVYKKTSHLTLDVRTFVDLFAPKFFPSLEWLLIKCEPIHDPGNRLGLELGTPLNDKEFQHWAKKQQMVLERRSGKTLLYKNFVTVLDSGYEQWTGPGYVWCHLTKEMGDVIVDREACV